MTSEPSLSPLLEVTDLVIDFPTEAGPLRAVDGITFSVAAGETVGLVGESGSGKSVTALSLMRMLSPRAQILRGSIKYLGRDLTSMTEDELRHLRGKELALVSQDPMTSLNPILTVRRQVEEVITAHARLSRRETRRRAEEVLATVGIDVGRIDDHPHHFSGGMRQRVTIAIAIANRPKLLIADEPTTALDVTIQAQILELLRQLNDRLGTAIILISHDLGVVAEVCARVLVMYAGQVLEDAPVELLFRQPQHPYTLGLLRSRPQLDGDRSQRLPTIEGRHPDPWQRPDGCPFHPRCGLELETACTTIRPNRMAVAFEHSTACWVVQHRGVAALGVLAAPVGHAADDPGDAPSSRPSSVPALRPAPAPSPETDTGIDTDTLVELRKLTKHFPLRRTLPWGAKRVVRAVDGVDLSIRRGMALGLVGESGCGKSTLARVLIGIQAPTSGELIFDGVDITRARPSDQRLLRRQMQMIFQDPYASLDPRMKVGDTVAEPLAVHALASGQARSDRVAALLDLVGLSPELSTRYPHELSGGQRQRVGIARALAVEPVFIVCDEPLSSLDVSIQAQIVNLLQDLRRRLHLTYLLVAHDLAVVRHMTQTIAVMYLGRIVEVGDSDSLCRFPLHPYTAALLASVPQPGRRRSGPLLSGDLPSPIELPSGCRFRSRCPIGPLHQPERTICAEVEPPLKETRPGRLSACHFAGELIADEQISGGSLGETDEQRPMNDVWAGPDDQAAFRP
ncbi:MAG: dipeptide ABC transporter ATP-binding protein [Acidimicrobiales bacterium]